MAQSTKRLLALLLALMLCISLIPAAALAEGEDEDAGSIQLVEDPEPDEEEDAGDIAPAPEPVFDPRHPIAPEDLPPADELDETYSGSCGTDLNWSLNTSTGVLTITGSGAMSDYTYGGSPWFSYRSSITSVKLPSGLTKIGAYAFYGCTNLASVTIPSKVTAIKSSAFAFCRSLTSVTIPASVTSIGTSAFGNCSGLTAITVDSGNTAYSSQSGVLYNKGKTSLIQFPGGKSGAFTIPGTVTKICSRAFEACMGLTGVTIPKSVTSIEDYAFDSCYDLTAFTVDSGNAVYASQSGVLYNKGKTTLLRFPCGKSGAFTVPGTVTTIDEGGFDSCLSLTSVTIPSSVTTIGDYAFSYCTSLAEVWFKGKAPSFGNYVFTFTSTAAYYPEANSSWTAGVRQGYGGSVVWVPCRSGTPVNPFTDVKEGKFFYTPVLWAYYHEPQITGGTDTTHFSPNQACTRAQIVTFLWNTCGKPEPSSTTNPFVDVKSGKYYYKAVLWAVEQGITKGVDATHFGPNEPCTRAQVVTFLWIACGKAYPASNSNPFQDVNANKYYTQAVLWAYYAGITSGADATHFAPNNICTRGQVMTFLFNARWYFSMRYNT